MHNGTPRRKVLWDVDGCLCATTEAVLAALQAQGKLHGRTIDEVRHWNWADSFPGEVTLEEIWAVYEDLSVLERAPCCPHALRAAQLCGRLGYEIHIVTARGTYDPSRADLLAALTRSWLAKHQIPYDVLAFVAGKGKSDYAREHGLHLAIEDNRETAYALTEHCWALLPAYGYNAPLDGQEEPRRLLRIARSDISQGVMAVHHALNATDRARAAGGHDGLVTIPKVLP